MRLPPITATRRTDEAFADVEAFLAADFFAVAFAAGVFSASDVFAGVLSAMAVSSVVLNDGMLNVMSIAPLLMDWRQFLRLQFRTPFQIPLVSER